MILLLWLHCFVEHSTFKRRIRFYSICLCQILIYINMYYVHRLAFHSKTLNVSFSLSLFTLSRACYYYCCISLFYSLFEFSSLDTFKIQNKMLQNRMVKWNKRQTERREHSDKQKSSPIEIVFHFVNCKFVYSCENLQKYQIKQAKQIYVYGTEPNHSNISWLFFFFFFPNFPFAVHVQYDFRQELTNPNPISLSHTKQMQPNQIQKFERVTSSPSDMANKYIQCYTLHISSAFETSFVTTFTEHFFFFFWLR